MLGYYKWTQSKDEREKIDTKIKLQYENKLSDWMGIEAIVRQKDRETTAANIARLSGNTPGKTKTVLNMHCSVIIGRNPIEAKGKSDVTPYTRKCFSLYM